MDHVLRGLREQRPLVQCITNSVVTNFTANVLLSAGASPAMSDVPGEAGPFAEIADALLVNLGTPTSEQRDAAREAVRADVPWVLDPVGVGALTLRTELAFELLRRRPGVIRGNASEILVLARAGSGARGVDAQDSSDSALDAARRLAGETGSVVAVSGETDYVTDGERTLRIEGGSELLTRVTGAGCSLGALMAACLAVAPALEAAAAASAAYAVASERAERQSRGPGSFAVALLDEIAALRPEDLSGRVAEEGRR
ncbi:hydroxyethylthiazole kinase [Arthrobacter sp. UM1]|uniref:hydroxyethylthiazole kinase n=1 Tax=Arthrobacter sp. UM1 TaxID=2766776 RepID=UPI001CF6D707|nr:hydroxyethylthiazole kinase [Arthrobacter sp. UM1]